jgi:homocysteine S-methyltransferase
VLGAVEAARRVTGKPVIVYPNSGEEWEPSRRMWIGQRTLATAMAGHWVDAGARIVGGCCRVGPDQIAAIASAVAKLRHQAF